MNLSYKIIEVFIG